MRQNTALCGNGLTLSQTTNFRPFQIERACRQFLVRRKWRKTLQRGRKPCGKKRNCSLRAISPFPTGFSKDFYCRHVKTRACLGKGERPRKRRLFLVTSIFSFSNTVFQPIQKRNHHLSRIHFIVCNCFQLGTVQNVVVSERVDFRYS